MIIMICFDDKDGDSLPTPTYNSSILGDMFLEKKSNLLKNRLSQWEGLPDALILLKVCLFSQRVLFTLCLFWSL